MKSFGNVKSVPIDRLKKLNKATPMSREVFNMLVVKAQGGDLKARNVIVTHNVGLVLRVCGRSYSWSQDIDDYFQEGCLGLMRAIETFDVTRGFAFSTYAESWIRHKMQRYRMNCVALIRTPVYVQEIKRIYAKKTEQSDDEQVAVAHVTERMTAYHSEESVEKALKVDIHTMSINVPHEDGEDGFDLPSENTDLENTIKWLDVQYLMGYLDYRAQRILKYRMDGLTLQEIGEIEDLSRERVRQVFEASIMTMQTVANLRNDRS